MRKLFEHISLKSGLTVTEIKTSLFIVIIFLVGLIAKEIKYEYLETEQKIYSYEIYDSLFNSTKDENLQNLRSDKKDEKRVDSEAELSDFSNNKKELKKNGLKSGKSFLVNLNRASIEELDRIPGIGKLTAQRIIDLRKKKGGFKNIEELLEVKRIGKKTLEKLKKYLIIEN